MKHFEVILIGSEVSGLVAGALLAKSGRRVLHLDPTPTRSAYKFRDLTFFRQLQLFSSWDSSPAQKRAFFDLNLISDMSRRLVPIEPSFQVILPEHRLDVWRNEADLTGELEREFPGSGLHAADALQRIQETNERLDKLLDGRLILPPETWSERRELKRKLGENPLPSPAEIFDGAPPDHPLRRFAELPMRFFTRLDPDAESPVRFARAARQLRSGLYELPGGLDDLKDALAGVIRHFHGEGLSEPIDEVTLSWGRIKSLRLRSGDVIGCDQVIGAELAGRLAEILPGNALGRGYARLAAGLRPTRRVYTLNLAIRPEAIPEGMGPVGFLVRSPGRPLQEENLLLWSLRGNAELRALTIACLVGEPQAHEREFLRGLKARVLDSLQTLIPFLSRHLVQVDVPWDDGEAVGDAARPADEMAAMYTWEAPSALGIAALPMRTSVKNLLVANRQILPALGLEGEFLAGAAVARLMHTAKEKKSWFD